MSAAFLILGRTSSPNIEGWGQIGDWLAQRLPGSSPAVTTVRARYPQGQGALGQLLKAATARGFTVEGLSTERDCRPSDSDGAAADRNLTELTLHVHGKAPLNELAEVLSEVPGVEAVVTEAGAYGND